MIRKAITLLLFTVIILGIIPSSFSQKNATDTISNTTSKVDQTAEKWLDFLLRRNQDTNYILNMSDRFSLRLVAVNKFNFFQIRDKINSSRLLYRPEIGVNPGIGFTYKSFAVDIDFNVGLREDKEFLSSRYFDIQFKVFTSKHLFGLTVQYYYAYEINREVGLSQELTEEEKRREDIRKINFSLNWLYAFNYERFSMKAPFVFNELQRKSAGSPIVGLDLELFALDADSIMIPISAQPDFDPQIYLTDENVFSVTMRVGYMYTFAIRQHFFITLGFIPGLVLNMGDYRTDYRQSMPTHFSWDIAASSAIGYNGNNFYTGIQFMGDVYNVRIAKKLSNDIAQGSAKIVFGYRFKKKNRKLYFR